jgi:hypothetical protein
MVLSRHTHRHLGLTLCIGLALAVFPDVARADEITPPDWSVLTGVVVDFESVLKGYLPAAKALARDLLLLLIAIELAVSGALWGLSRMGIDEFVFRIAVKTCLFALILKVIQDTGNPSGLFNIEHIPNGFRALAGTLSGLSAPYPGDVLDTAAAVITDILEYADSESWFFISWTEMSAMIAINIIWLAFGAVAIRLFVAIIHSIVAWGSATIADRYLGWVFAVSLRLFFLDLLISLAQLLLPAVFASIPLNGVLDLFLFPLIALTYAGLALYVPNSASRLLTDNLNFQIARYVNL